MTFQITALHPAGFAGFFDMGPEALAKRRARIVVCDVTPGYPCRVSLEDARPGERVLLVHHVHQAAETPYHASHAIYVREGARQARPAAGEVPDALARRLLSVRAFDAAGMMQEADVCDGGDLGPVLTRMLSDDRIAVCQIHHARQGCFAAGARRAA